MFHAPLNCYLEYHISSKGRPDAHLKVGIREEGTHSRGGGGSFKNQHFGGGGGDGGLI